MLAPKNCLVVRVGDMPSAPAAVNMDASSRDWCNLSLTTAVVVLRATSLSSLLVLLVQWRGTTCCFADVWCSCLPVQQSTTTSCWLGWQPACAGVASSWLMSMSSCSTNSYRSAGLIAGGHQTLPGLPHNSHQPKHNHHTAKHYQQLFQGSGSSCKAKSTCFTLFATTPSCHPLDQQEHPHLAL